MAREQPIELFMPPNMLKAKVGGGTFSGLDMAAIKRAVTVPVLASAHVLFLARFAHAS